MFADFQNYLIFVFSVKFATECVPYLPAHLKRITALACEIRNIK